MHTGVGNWRGNSKYKNWVTEKELRTRKAINGSVHTTFGPWFINDHELVKLSITQTVDYLVWDKGLLA